LRNDLSSLLCYEINTAINNNFKTYILLPPLASPPNCITAKVMCSCNEALFMQSDYSSVRIWRFQPLHLQLAGMLKQMLGEIGRTWSSEGSWRRRHVINAGSFIFVPIIEWKRRACIVMPSSEDKSVVLS
jgi:hypothetical protein